MSTCGGLPSHETALVPDFMTIAHASETSHERTQDTGKFRTNRRDQFYTKESVAKACIQRVLVAFPDAGECLWVEPSAGNGSFLHNVPSSFRKMGMDLEPKAPDIIEQDYLQWTPPSETTNAIVFGNPPFGRQSSLAKAFIAKSCKFAQIIAFILPKSFTKPSMFNAFETTFHLVESTELERDSFVINGSKYDVPCVFQIWQKKNFDRPMDAKTRPCGFEYVKSTEACHIAFRRVGGLAGRCYKVDDTPLSAQSHYFIRLNADVQCNAERIIAQINRHTFPSNTIGPRSLSKSEASTVINAIIRSDSSYSEEP